MKFDETFAFAGIDDYRVLIDLVIKLTVFFQAITSLIFALLGFHLLSLIAYISLPFLSVIAFWLWVTMQVDSRSRQSDEVLPDALQMMASNIRAGMTPDVALLLSAKSEFGPLGAEIRRAAKEAMTGETLETALLQISKRIQSKTLGRTLNLIVEGMRSGGSLASLLEETSMDLRNALMLLREVKANVMTYFVFILMAVGLGAPVLFGISMTMVSTMTQMTQAMKIPEGTNSIIKMKPSKGLDVGFMNNFSMACIGLTVFFGSLTLGVIEAGKELDGLKYILFLALLSFGLFFGTRMLVGSIFSGMAQM